MSEPGGCEGFTRLGNTLLDAMIRYPFTKRQLTILLALIRKTRGYNKAADDLSTRQLAAITGIDQADCSRTLGELHRLGIVAKERGDFGQRLRVISDPRQWKACPSFALPPDPAPLTRPGDGDSPAAVMVNHPRGDGFSPSTGMAIRHRGDGRSPSEEMVNHHRQKTTPKDQMDTHTPRARAPAKTAATRRAVRTPLPPDFGLSERVRQWAAARGFDRLDEHFDAFCSKARANGYTYADWDAALQNAIREDWARLRAGPSLTVSATRSAHETSSPLRSAVDRVRASGQRYLAEREAREPLDAADYRPHGPRHG